MSYLCLVVSTRHILYFMRSPMHEILKTPLAESLPLEFHLLVVCARTQLDDVSAAQLRTLVAAGMD